MIKQLINLANHLDKKGLLKEADYLDAVISKLANERDPSVVEKEKELQEQVWRGRQNLEKKKERKKQKMSKKSKEIEEEEGEEEAAE